MSRSSITFGCICLVLSFCRFLNTRIRLGFFFFFFEIIANTEVTSPGMKGKTHLSDFILSCGERFSSFIVVCLNFVTQNNQEFNSLQLYIYRMFTKLRNIEF